MVEQNKLLETQNNADSKDFAEPSNMQEKNNNYENSPHRNIQGRFFQYTSSFWAIAIPSLMARYIARFSIKLFHLPEKLPKLVEKNKITDSIFSFIGKFYSSEALYPIVAGSGIMWIINKYKQTTFDDMKSVFSEAVAFDLGKDFRNVTDAEIKNSNNAIIKTTVQKVNERNKKRIGFAALFFIPWDFIYKFCTNNDFKKSGADPVDLGVGALGLYLASDVLTRKEALFEKWQRFIDIKINHVGEVGQIITPSDLLDIYDIHMRSKNKNYIAPQHNSIQWQEQVKQVERMVDLMNQTYNNTIVKEYAELTVPKLIYLWGGGSDGVPILNGHHEQNMAFIELANRSINMQEVREVSQAIRSGFPAQEAFAKYGIDLEKFTTTYPSQNNEELGNGFTTKIKEILSQPQEDKPLRNDQALSNFMAQNRETVKKAEEKYKSKPPQHHDNIIDMVENSRSNIANGTAIV